MPLSRDEFKCKCCGGLVLDEDFFQMACKAREISATPYIINSGYRCPKHNKEVGSETMNHVLGKAMDIQAKYGHDRLKIIEGLFFAGFTRIGIAKDFIHADNMPEVESCWLY
jgi:zinc D-Ala-D-Ala carboxypeptidase